MTGEAVGVGGGGAAGVGGGGGAVGAVMGPEEKVCGVRAWLGVLVLLVVWGGGEGVLLVLAGEVACCVAACTRGCTWRWG